MAMDMEMGMGQRVRGGGECQVAVLTDMVIEPMEYRKEPNESADSDCKLAQLVYIHMNECM